ncbi:MAG TPA: hypothetical protein VFY99_01715, partial [Solirubrobacterales bacterium]
MGWRHDEKKARKLADSDPAGAVALLDRVIPAVEKSMLGETEHVLELLELKAELAERAEQDELARATRADLRERIDAAIAESDAVIEAGEGGAMKIGGALEQKARCLDRLGEPTEANRLRLQAADVNLAAVGDEGAKARNAATPFLVATQGAMGFETSRAFQHGFESNYRAAAEVLRDPLLADGSAVALAYCKRCGGVVEANWKKHRCVKRHKVDEVRVVLT